VSRCATRVTSSDVPSCWQCGVDERWSQESWPPAELRVADINFDSNRPFKSITGALITALTERSTTYGINQGRYMVAISLPVLPAISICLIKFWFIMDTCVWKSSLCIGLGLDGSKATHEAALDLVMITEHCHFALSCVGSSTSALRTCEETGTHIWFIGWCHAPECSDFAQEMTERHVVTQSHLGCGSKIGPNVAPWGTLLARFNLGEFSVRDRSGIFVRR
jgi:hypothetical protein